MFPSNLTKSTNFPNMAGVVECDKWIEKELIEAGVTISSGYENWRIHKKAINHGGVMIVSQLDDYITKYVSKSEVPFHIIGKLGNFTFERCWYYYSVEGNVPLDIANKLYKNPIGMKDVRVVGHCGCPPPKEWCDIIDDKEYITSYHIDSQEGLNLFVEMIKELIK